MKSRTGSLLSRLGLATQALRGASLATQALRGASLATQALRGASLACVLLAVAACNGRASTSTSTSAGEAQAAETAATPASEHAPGQWMFKRIEALDLRPAQRDSIAEIRENLRDDLAPHRETLRQIAKNLAGAIEAGHLEASDAAAHQAALQAAAADAKAVIATAMNAVHDTLDASQRVALVERLRAEHEGVKGADAPQHDGPLARLALEIGLTEEQKASLHNAVQEGADEIFPDRKANREEHEARMKAMADAFVSDEFDAASFDLAPGAERHLEAFTQVATRAVVVSEKVLSLSQRQAMASMIRSHAAKL